MRYLLVIAALLAPIAAGAQQRVGPLDTRNNLGEIAASGTNAQAAARANLGLPASASVDTTNAANITAGTLPAARLPAPTTSALGGVQANVAAAHQWISYIDTAGVPHLLQPSAADISGLAASATTDTTNAANISSGTLSLSRLPSIPFTQMTGSPSSAQIIGGLGFTPYDAANPAGFVNSAGAASAAPVQSVAGRSGAVTLSTSDISGLGSIATQSAAAAAITGGTISGATVGASSATATGGTTARTLADMRSDVIYAADQGVVCDGVTNDATRAQAAINYAAGLNKRLVFTPTAAAGQCLLNSTLTLPSNADIDAVGNVTLKAGVSGRIFNSTNTSNVHIRHLILNGNYPGASKFFIITFTNVSGGSIEDLTINNPGSEIQLINGTSNVTVARVTMSNSGQHGITLDNVCDNVITQNVLNGQVGFGILLQNGACRNLLQGNRTTNSGIELIGIKWDAFDNRVIGNHAQGTGDNGISISGYRNTATGNTLVRNAHSGIGVYGERNTVTGNTMIDNGQTGNFSTRYACIFVKSGSAGIAQYNTISGNLCDDDQSLPTTAYGIYTSAGYYAQWTASTAYSVGNFVFNGNILYTNNAGGTSSTTAPTCLPRQGTCSDGGITWTPLRDLTQPLAPLWSASRSYVIGEAVWNGANLYTASAAGISASSGGPTCTSGTCADGSVTWSYTAAKAPSWAASTVYGAGSYVSTASAVYFNNSAGTSGTTSPTCVSVGQTCSDGGITWTFLYSLARDFQSDLNFIGMNRVLRVGVAETFDDTSSKTNYWVQTNQIQTLNMRLDNTSTTNTWQFQNSDGQFQRSAVGWSSGVSAVYGQYFRALNSLYQVINVGGTTANQPSCGSGTCTGADGIQYRFVSTSPGFLGATDIQMTSNGSQFNAPISMQNPAATTTFAKIYVVAGSPAGVVTAPPGSIALNTSGGAGATFYVKESGVDSSGWVAK